MKRLLLRYAAVVAALVLAGCAGSPPQPEPASPPAIETVLPAANSESRGEAEAPRLAYPPPPAHPALRPGTAAYEPATTPAPARPIFPEAPPEPAVPAITAPAPVAAPLATTSAGVLILCCSSFNEAMAARVRPSLIASPGVSGVEPLHQTDGRLCYRMRYRGSPRTLAQRMEQQLNPPGIDAIRSEIPGGGRVDLYYDAGFD